MSEFSHTASTVEPTDVLLVEDDPHDVRLLREAFETTERNRETRLHAATSGTDAVTFLTRSVESDSVSAPNLVVLNPKLPGRGGLEVLETITDDPRLRRLPVVILTGSDDADDIARCYEARANAYLTKPSNLDEFVSLVETIERFWLGHAVLPTPSA